VPPPAEGAGGVGQGPEEMPLDDGVEPVTGWFVGGALDHSDVQPLLRSLGPQLLEHPGREVEGRHLVAEPGGRQAEESGAGTDVEHPGRGRGQQAVQCRRPRGPGQHRRRMMAGRAVIGGGVGVPELAHLGQRLHAGVFSTGPGAASPETGQSTQGQAAWRPHRPCNTGRSPWLQLHVSAPVGPGVEGERCEAAVLDNEP
jgi:hypothetical protein